MVNGVSRCQPSRRVSFILAAVASLVFPSCWSAKAHAERSTFQTYGTEQGLTSLDAKCLAQDRAGNILICTEHGVFAYAGRRFLNLGTENGLPEGGYVYGAALTASGRMAVQYSDGVYVSDEASDPSHPATSLSFHSIDHPGLSFYANRPHRLVPWRNGFVVLAEDSAVRITMAPGMRARVETLSYDQADRALLKGAAAVFAVDGHLWETFDDGRICAADPGDVRCYDAKDGLSAGRWLDITAGGGGRILARSASSVATLDPLSTHWSSSTLPDQGGSYQTFASSLGVYRAPDGRLITQSSKGLDILGPEGWQELTIADGAPDGVISDAMTDVAGELWFHIIGRGLVRWVGYGHWETLEKTDGLSDGFPWQTARSADGSLWVTTDNGVDQIVRRGSSLHVSRVYAAASYALVATPEGNVWAGFAKGVQIIDPVTGSVSVVTTPGVETIVPDRDHTVWLGTAKGLYKVDDSGSLPFHATLLKAAPTPVQSVVRDGGGGVYYLCGDRLHHWRSDGTDVSVSKPGLLAELDPIAMSIAHDGDLWIGGSGGLIRLRLSGDQIRSEERISTVDTHTTTVYALMVDHRGWVWVGTSHGVSVYDGKRWVSAEVGQGLLANDINEDGIREDPDGSVWIATTRGVSHLRDPASLFVARHLDVMVADAQVGSRSVDAAHLPYTHGPISLDFETLNYGMERPVLFRHRLSGVDAGWVASSSFSVSYPFVPPGRHLLTVVGYDQLTHLESRPATFVIDIAYPWWRRWWSETLWAALAAGLIYAGVRVRLRSMYVRQAELKRHVAQATEQLRYQASHDKLTGLLTRSEIESRLAEKLAKGNAGEELVIALIDVDHFKCINDNHGHLGGDEILRALGRSISRAIRRDELAGRYGGEEILLVLTDTDGRAAERVLNLHLSIRHDTFKVGNNPIRVTCSVGVAWASHGDNWETLIGRADAALYEAKGAGRDRVVESRLLNTHVSDVG